MDARMLLSQLPKEAQLNKLGNVRNSKHKGTSGTEILGGGLKKDRSSRFNSPAGVRRW